MISWFNLLGIDVILFRKCKANAELRGSSKVNMEDLLQVFERRGRLQVDMSQLIKVTEQKMWDVPFLSGIPDYPLAAEPDNDIKLYDIPAESEKTASKGSGTNSRPDYIPSFFPDLPPAHTYKLTYDNSTEDAEASRDDQVVSAMNVQDSLAKLDKARDSASGTGSGSKAAVASSSEIKPPDARTTYPKP